jgi:hypothetical protein
MNKYLMPHVMHECQIKVSHSLPHTLIMDVASSRSHGGSLLAK